MGGYEDLKTAISALIRTNGNQEITGATLQSTLFSIINTVGQGAVFMGIATTSTNPGSPDANVFYIAAEPGFYPNFNLSIANGISIFENKTGAWVGTQILSDFALSSGEVISSLSLFGDDVDFENLTEEQKAHMIPNAKYAALLSSYFQRDTGMLAYDAWPRAILYSTQLTPGSYDLNPGEMVIRQTDQQGYPIIEMYINPQKRFITLGRPLPGIIFVEKITGKLYTWSEYEEPYGFVPVNSGGGNAGQITNINDGQNYRIWVGTQEDLDALNGVFEDDVIYLVGTIPQAVTKFDVITSGLTHCSVPTGTPAKVTENGSFTVVVSPESGYTIDSCQATMGSSTINGVPLTGANAGKYQITINAVTANIVIKASASVHLQSITVTQGTRTGNSIPMNAALDPSNAENVTLQWSASGSQNVTINQSTGLLTILEGASNESVTVTCTDTNSASGAASGTLQLTGLSYNDSVPLVSLGAVSYTAGAAANTYQFSVAKNPAGANTHSIKWDIDSVSPRGAATINADTGLLTITDDCEVVVSAKAYQGMAQDTTINTATSGSVRLTFDASNSPIVFEDPAMEAFMLNKVPHANANYITRAEAASYTNNSFCTKATAATYPFEGIKGSVTKFNEWQYFTGLTSINFEDFSVLTEVTMPSTVLLNNSNFKYFNNTQIKRLVLPEGLTSFALSCLSNSELEEIVFPSTLTSISAGSSSNNTLTAKVKVFDLSNTQLTTCDWYRPKLGSVEILKFPSSLQTIGNETTQTQLFRYNANIKYVEIGTANGGSSLTFMGLNGKSIPSGVSIILRKIINSDSDVPEYKWTSATSTADVFYVPDNAVGTYKAATGWSGVASKIVSIKTLPIGWDTQSSDNSGNTQEGGQS